MFSAHKGLRIEQRTIASTGIGRSRSHGQARSQVPPCDIFASAHAPAHGLESRYIQHAGHNWPDRALLMVAQQYRLSSARREDR